MLSESETWSVKENDMVRLERCDARMVRWKCNGYWISFCKLPTNCLSVFDHFVGFALKGLKKTFIGKMANPAILCTFEILWSNFALKSRNVETYQEFFKPFFQRLKIQISLS